MTTKPYQTNEPIASQSVSEPAISYGEEAQPPCQFTVEELKAGVRIAMRQSAQGLGFTQEEMCKRERPWKKL